MCLCYRIYFFFNLTRRKRGNNGFGKQRGNNYSEISKSVPSSSKCRHTIYEIRFEKGNFILFIPTCEKVEVVLGGLNSGSQGGTYIVHFLSAIQMKPLYQRCSTFSGTGDAIAWLSLEERTVRNLIGKQNISMSKWRPVRSGCPQGSV